MEVEKTNEAGVRISGSVDFTRWHWDRHRRYSVECAEIVLNEVVDSCWLSIHTGAECVEDMTVELMFFDSDMLLRAKFLDLIDREIKSITSGGTAHPDDKQNLVQLLETALERARAVPVHSKG